MRTFIQATTLAFTLALGVGSIAAGTARAAETSDAIKKPDMKKVGQHLRDHQKYPASRAELLESCNNLVDFTDGEKRWFADHLPEGTYKSAAEVLKALKKS